MIFKFGNMFENMTPGDICLVTTNSYIRKDGALVMGRGAAKQAASMYPNLPFALGQHIDHLGEYNVGIITDKQTGRHMGAFQVKYNFIDEADLKLIERSARCLHHLAVEDGRVFHVNYPGIGNGRVSIDDVEPLIKDLPDNVCVWRFS